MIVKFYATYRQLAGCESCEIPAPDNVLALLKDLTERFPEFRGVILNADGTDKSDYAAIMVSGRYSEHLNGMATKLTDEDVVALMPIVAGGCLP